MQKRALLILAASVFLAWGAGCSGCGDEPPSSNNATENNSTENNSTENNSTENNSTENNNNMERPPAPTIVIDDTLTPHTEALPAFEDGVAREVTAVLGEDGVVGNFVADEVLVMTDDDDELQQLLDASGGEVVHTIDPSADGVATDLETIHVVRVDHEALTLDGFEQALMEASDASEFGPATGEIAFQSEEGAKLVALAAKHHTLPIGLNWVGQADAIPNTTQEDGSRDAYTFDYFQNDSAWDTGVVDAWNLLYAAGRLEERSVKLAILDMGFKASDDIHDPITRTVWPGFGPLNDENPYGCSGGNPCPWHGTNAASAAMAAVDNSFGSAGSGGPVARPILVYTTYDYLASITGVLKARGAGARIISMSYSAGVPWYVAWTTLLFRAATDDARDHGVMLFASAGNDDRNVDAEKCVLGICWEKTYYTPCENPGVQCVGGLSNQNTKDDGSNYGNRSVDLWAPWCVDVGPDPETPSFHNVCGTSFSSPFAAGVAALIKAANPSLGGRDITSLMQATANGYRGEAVDAYEAVLSALGATFTSQFGSPLNGGELTSGIPTNLMVRPTIISPSGPDVEVQVRWLSSLDGELGTSMATITRPEGDDRVHTAQAFLNTTLTPGTHVLTAISQAVIPDAVEENQTYTAEVTVTVTDPPPTVSITSPTDGADACQGETITLRADVMDPNSTIPDEEVRWSASKDAMPYPIFYTLGEGRVQTVDDLPPGNYSINVVVEDESGQVARDDVLIDVISSTDPMCSDLPPTAIITAPMDGVVWMVDDMDASGYYKEVTFTATATDPEDDDATLDVEWFSNHEGKLGEGRSLTAKLYLHDSCSTQHVIELRVTDSDGNVKTDTITVGIYVVC